MLKIGVLLRTFATLSSAFLAVGPTSIKSRVSKSGNYYAKQSSVIKSVSVVNGVWVDKRVAFVFCPLHVLEKHYKCLFESLMFKYILTTCRKIL